MYFAYLWWIFKIKINFIHIWICVEFLIFYSIMIAFHYTLSINS